MDYIIDLLIRQLHKSPFMTNIYATGGGSSVFPLLLNGGGGSATLIGGRIPYHPTIHENLIGGKIDRLVSEADSRALAMAAYQEAVPCCQDKTKLVGVGVTASLIKTEGEREGRTHSIFISTQTYSQTTSYSLIIEGGASNERLLREWGCDTKDIRLIEEEVVTYMTLNAIAKAFEVNSHISHFMSDLVQIKQANANSLHPKLADVVMGNRPLALFVCSDKAISSQDDVRVSNMGIVSGSFNPPHEAHWEMLDKLDAEPKGFELCVKNVDKPPLDYLTIQERLNLLANGPRPVFVLVTSTPRFIDKARKFQGCTFGIGYDTAVRIVDPKYHNGDREELHRSFEELKHLNANFMVFGRKDNKTGEFKELNDNEFPKSFLDISTKVSKEQFNNEASSTQIRKESQ